MDSDKIRLLYIQQTIGSGGVERRRLLLAKKLDKTKFELKIICTQIKGPLVDQIRAQGVEVIPIVIYKHPFDWKCHKKVQQIIDDYQPNIIHGAVFEGVTMAAVNGFVKRVPRIIIEETSDPVTRSWKANLLMKFFGRISDCAIGVSPAAVEYLLYKANISSSKVKLINNGVAIPRNVSEEEKVALKKELGIKSNELVVGSVGRMLQDDNKRFSDLIKAFALLSKNNPNCKLLLVGEGPEKEGYQNLVKRLEIEKNVIFAGYQSDTDLYYAVMDVFCLVSAHEAFGLVLAEAMLHKLPIVATAVGGMKYIVKDKETGFLVKRFDIKAISMKLQLFISDKNLREKFGQEAFRRALNKYTEEIYVGEIEKVYLNLLK